MCFQSCVMLAAVARRYDRESMMAQMGNGGMGGEDGDDYGEEDEDAGAGEGEGEL